MRRCNEALYLQRLNEAYNEALRTMRRCNEALYHEALQSCSGLAA
jgi:hypothetical protein